jgi:hypothetical protein
MWLGLALIATLLSIWFKVAAALSEIVVGTIAQLIIGAAAADFSLAVDDPAIKFLSGAGASSSRSWDAPRPLTGCLAGNPGRAGSGAWQCLRHRSQSCMQ